MKHTIFAASIALALLLTAWAVPAGAQVEVQVGFLVDGSATISAADFDIVKDALARAVTDSNLVPMDGTIEITVVQFSDQSATVELAPTVINGSTGSTIANAIRSMTQGGGGTPLWLGLDRMTDLMINSPNFSNFSRQVINVATDGQPQVPVQGIFISEGATLSLTARDRAIALGIDEIDAEGVGDGISTQEFQDFLLNLVWPQPGVFFDPNNGNPQGFVSLVSNFQGFEDAIREKINNILTTAGVISNNNTNNDRDRTSGVPIPFDSPISVLVLVSVMVGMLFFLRRFEPAAK